ncbi:DUF6941 family protein [Longimicrobium terrae]|uniref:Uncharacterized protein n=1 Tax=Longimicrobium terrae TaxID=1639882 RepID=A0A841H004_9BACT|nr:hypothetical protein [Longimicrobium terrae]MBB4637001.1 hypothetical protein [Longimicrobium terrae]MBB6071391.1 hypothetical protein [Longimicrobium terrae]NNC31393.1 hypothetical protein [Longimicrobium terrae]
MNVLYSVIAEEANLRHDGRMDVSGIFHELYAPGFPAQQERLTLVVTMEWAAEERGSIDFSVNLLDPARSPVLTINAQTQVEDQYAIHRAARTQMAIPMDGIVFPTPGTYQFELTVGEHKEDLAKIYLIEDANAH